MTSGYVPTGKPPIDPYSPLVSPIDAAASAIERELVRGGLPAAEATALVATLTIAYGIAAGRRETMTVADADDPPMVIGRSDNDDTYVRAETRLVRRREHAWEGATSGRAVAEYYHSTDDEDRGGVVLRIRLLDAECAMLPYAENIPGGVDFHIAGDEEARAVCRVLRELLAR